VRPFANLLDLVDLARREPDRPALTDDLRHLTIGETVGCAAIFARLGATILVDATHDGGWSGEIGLPTVRAAAARPTTPSLVPMFADLLR
jgi:hypothetical protein